MGEQGTLVTSITCMNKLSVGLRVILAISFMVAVVLVGANMGYWGVRYTISQGKTIAAQIKQHHAVVLRSVDLSRSATVHFKTQVQEWKNMLLRGRDAEALAKHLDGFKKEAALMDQTLADLRSFLDKNKQDTGPVGKCLAEHQALTAQYLEAFKSYDPQKPDAPTVVDKLVKGIDRPATDALEALVAQALKFDADVTRADEERFDQRMRWLLGVFVVGSTIGILMGIACALYVSKSLAKQLMAIATTLQENSTQVSACAGQVATASQCLADGASQQAASLEETSSSLEQMSSVAKRNTERARQAKELADQAREAGDTGAHDMEIMSQAMGTLKEASADIAKIIKAIDEIAFQTNILALNAAVEAARAGEAGLGFAVVASEVRTLAQRSAEAAKETAAKIATSLNSTEQGVQASTKVANSLREIARRVREVDDLIAEVASASTEQSQGVEQVNSAVTLMDKVTQSNAASAEESASGAEELNAQAATLKEMVDQLQALVGGKRR